MWGEGIEQAESGVLKIKLCVTLELLILTYPTYYFVCYFKRYITCSKGGV